MKTLFTFSFLAIAVMWVGAVLTIPKPRTDKETLITWSTDPNPARKNQLSAFERQNPEIGVLVEPESFEKTIVQCSTGVGPDLIEMYSNGDMASYAEAGILLDLTPYAEQYGFSLDRTWPKLRNNLKYKGKIYRFPANASSNVLMYNKAIFREAAIPEPENSMTWPEFIELIKPLTVRRQGGGYERFALSVIRGFVADIPLQFGGRFFSEDLTSSAMDSPEFIQGMQLYKDLIRVHNIVPSPEAADALSASGGWGSGEIKWFESGRTATLWGARWMLVLFRDTPIHADIGVVTLPRPVDGVSASYSGARGPGINANSDNIEASLKFLGYLASEEYSEIIALGSDALPPNAEYGSDPENLWNPEYPQETYQEVFIESMRLAEPKQVSPFIDSKVAERHWNEALDFIDNELKSVPDALRDAAHAVNTEIRRNIRAREDLAQLYLSIKNRPYSDEQPL